MGVALTLNFLFPENLNNWQKLIRPLVTEIENASKADKSILFHIVLDYTHQVFLFLAGKVYLGFFHIKNAFL